MKLAFYKAARGSFWSKSIAWFTHGPYSHVEIVFANRFDKSQIFAPQMDIREHDAGGSLCFSSAENDGGTRFKILNLNDGKWDIYEVPVIGELAAFQWCLRHQNLKYDWRGLRGFVFPWENGDPNDLFCSETATQCLQDIGVLKAPFRADHVSPNMLAEIAETLGWQKEDL